MRVKPCEGGSLNEEAFIKGYSEYCVAIWKNAYDILIKKRIESYIHNY